MFWTQLMSMVNGIKNVKKNYKINCSRAMSIVGIRIFQPWFQFEPFFRMTKYHKRRERTTSDMRSFIKDVLRKRMQELNATEEVENNSYGDKRIRIFIDELIKLSVEEKCFSEEEMISETLTMLIAVSFNIIELCHP